MRGSWGDFWTRNGVVVMKQEETHLAARTLGASMEDIARFERVAQSFGPRTTLSNSDVYEAIWFVGINSLMQGRPIIPTSAEIWAGEVWFRLCNLMLIRSWEVGPMFEIKRTAEALWAV
jgi:hypothetical protein